MDKKYYQDMDFFYKSEGQNFGKASAENFTWRAKVARLAAETCPDTWQYQDWLAEIVRLAREVEDEYGVQSYSFEEENGIQ